MEIPSKPMATQKVLKVSESVRATEEGKATSFTQEVPLQQLNTDLIIEAERKKAEAFEIEKREKARFDEARLKLADFRSKLETARQKEQEEEALVKRSIEIERRLELDRARAHEEAVLHEQKRVEAAALREAAEVQLKNLLSEIEKHELAARQAHAMAEIHEMEKQEALIAKRKEEYQRLNSDILEKDIASLDIKGKKTEEIVVIPRVVPEQVNLTQPSQAKPVVLKVLDSQQPVEVVEKTKEIEKKVTTLTVKETQDKREAVLKTTTINE